MLLKTDDNIVSADPAKWWGNSQNKIPVIANNWVASTEHYMQGGMLPKLTLKDEMDMGMVKVGQCHYWRLFKL